MFLKLIGSRVYKTCTIFTVGIAALILFRFLDPNGIVFYQGFYSAVLALLVVLFFFRKIESSIFSGFLLLLLFNALIVTTVDRAYSVRMLEWIYEEDGLSSGAIVSKFSNDFIAGGGVAKRVDEQTRTGLIHYDSGSFKVTPSGRFVVLSFALVRKIFNLQTR